MGFIENPRELEAAKDNGWLDAAGRATTEFAQVSKLDPTACDPNRPVDLVLRELVLRKLAKRKR